MDSSGFDLRRRSAYHRVDDIELASQPKYISPTHGNPVRMVIQATKQASEGSRRDWDCVPVTTNAPRLFRLSCWALGDGGIYSNGEVLTRLWRVFIVTPLYCIALVWPFYPDQPMTNYYKRFPSKSQDYPKYASNKFDANPNVASSVEWKTAVYDVVGEQKRLILPRQLVVKPDDKSKRDIQYEKDKGWVLSENTARPYIVISYTAVHLNCEGFTEKVVEQLAEKMAEEAGLDAYWIDYKCRADKNPQLTDDIHRICDVFRGASQVIVLLPDLSDKSKNEWGQRMWTLSEVLLSTHEKIKFVSVAEEKIEYTKMEISSLIWTDSESTRFLAEHYSNLLTLSRLEIISLGLTALSNRKAGTRWTDGDVAYALMALLRHRPRMNPTDTLFQALARLSLANDSDRIVERMVCMLPDPIKSYDTSFVLEDCLGANLWDIEPLCQIAGIGERDEVMIDGCLAVSIRWKDIPRIHYTRQDYWKKFCALFALRVYLAVMFPGVLLLRFGRSSVVFTNIFQNIGIAFVAIGASIALAASWLIRIVYGNCLPNLLIATMTSNRIFRWQNPGGIALAHRLRRHSPHTRD